MGRSRTAWPVAAVIAAALLAAGAGRSASEMGASSTAGLQPFGSCDELLGYFKQNTLPLIGPGFEAPPPGGGVPLGPTSGPTPSAATTVAVSGVDFSPTNIQEPGVDEPDIVKTNGSHIFAFAQGKLFAVDVRSDPASAERRVAQRPRVVGSLSLDAASRHELLLHGNRLLVFSGGAAPQPLHAPMPLPPGAYAVPPYVQPGSVLREIDVSDPAKMRVVRTLWLEGAYVSARLREGAARVVIASSLPSRLRLPIGHWQPKAQADSSRARLASSGIEDWLPSYVLHDAQSDTRKRRPLADCVGIFRPPAFGGFGMLTVLTIDLERGLEPVDHDAILTDGQIVYGSSRSLYVATGQAQRPLFGGLQVVPELVRTAIHKFDASQRTSTHYVASGDVRGFLLNQWALSEHDGVLRVATTETPTGWASRQDESFVTTLREKGSELVTLGRIGGLGRGESIFGVRFIGDVGYAVTFRRTDPLYTIELADPERPRVVGELKILGYSSYLHPLAEDLVLGVGQDATAQGGVLGLQLSVFDVSNLRRPQRLHRKKIESRASEAERDHHAFLYWQPTRLVVVPVDMYANGELFGAIGFRTSRARGIQEVGRVAYPRTVTGRGASKNSIPALVHAPIRRSIVVRNTLFTMSEVGIQANNVETFADRGSVSFR
jgi:uncharacterized secreted protein with C-terminal beta-propeller domain